MAWEGLRLRDEEFTFGIPFVSWRWINNGYGGDVGRAGEIPIIIYIDAVFEWNLKSEIWLLMSFGCFLRYGWSLPLFPKDWRWCHGCRSHMIGHVPVRCHQSEIFTERERERLILIRGHKFIDYILSGGITRILLRRLFLTIWLGCQETDWIDLVLAFLLSFVFRFGSNGNGIPFFDQQNLQLRWAPTRNGVISPL